VEEAWASERDESRQKKESIRAQRGTAMTLAHSLLRQGLIDSRTVCLLIAPAAYVFPAQRDESVDFAVSCMLKAFEFSACEGAMAIWGSDMEERVPTMDHSWGNILHRALPTTKRRLFSSGVLGKGILQKIIIIISLTILTRNEAGFLMDGGTTTWHGMEGKEIGHGMEWM
jgi:hypothetical protein